MKWNPISDNAVLFQASRDAVDMLLVSPDAKGRPTLDNGNHVAGDLKTITRSGNQIAPRGGGWYMLTGWPTTDPATDLALVESYEAEKKAALAVGQAMALVGAGVTARPSA